MNRGIENGGGIEFEESVSHEKPLRGRRPSNEDLKDSNEAGKSFNDIPDNDDTLEMNIVDDTLEMDTDDDKLEIGSAISKNDTLEIGDAIPKKKDGIIDKVKKFLK